MRRVTSAGEGLRGNSDAVVLRRYYGERDFITSPEGIMKLVSVVLCIVLAVLLLSSSCVGAPVRAAGAALELAAAAALAALAAARLLQLAGYAPMGYLIADLLLSAAIGVLLLVAAALALALCDATLASDYIHGLVGIASAGLVTGSAVITYVTVTRQWDEARARAPPPPRAPHELEV